LSSSCARSMLGWPSGFGGWSGWCRGTAAILRCRPRVMMFRAGRSRRRSGRARSRGGRGVSSPALAVPRCRGWLSPMRRCLTARTAGAGAERIWPARPVCVWSGRIRCMTCPGSRSKSPSMTCGESGAAAALSMPVSFHPTCRRLRRVTGRTSKRWSVHPSSTCLAANGARSIRRRPATVPRRTAGSRLVRLQCQSRTARGVERSAPHCAQLCLAERVRIGCLPGP
jgi:hypothetical protein